MATYNTRPNKVVDIVREGGVALGVQCYLPYPIMIDAYGMAGFDYIMMDMEHTRVNFTQMEDVVRACDCNDITPIFRVGSNDPSLIRACVEIGGKGVVVPHIKSAEDAANAVAYCHFNPTGSIKGGGALGMCPAVRHSRFGQDYPNYREWINENFSTIVLFEDLCALENWEAILDELTPGRDGIGFGMGDLGFSLLRKGEPDNSKEILAKYVPVIQKAAKERGLIQQNMIWWPSPDAAKLEECKEQGTNMVLTYPDNAWFAEVAADYIKRARS